jgi:hypothetical protein
MVLLIQYGFLFYTNKNFYHKVTEGEWSGDRKGKKKTSRLYALHVHYMQAKVLSAFSLYVEKIMSRAKKIIMLNQYSVIPSYYY